MRTLSLICLSLILLVGCSKGPPPTPTNPVPAGVVIPSGMPNDVWFNDNVLKSEVPVLVDFTAIWCGYCQMMKPDLHKIEEAYGDRLKVVAVDVDDHPYLSDFFEVKGLPQLAIIQDGKIVAKGVGARDYSGLLKFLNPVVGAP